MPTVDEVAAPYANHLVPVLPAGAGVCRVCHTSVLSHHDDALCSQCRGARHLSHLPDEVGIVALAVRDGQLATELWSYKTPRNDTAIEQVRLRLAALLWKWLAEHEQCIAAGAGVEGFPVVTTVPSTRPERQHDHPLRRIVAGMVGETRDRHRDLLRCAQIPDQALKRTPDPDRFEVLASDLRNAGPILLIDDTWTSGANAQSAVYALKERGARTVAVLCLGRWFNSELPRKKSSGG